MFDTTFKKYFSDIVVDSLLVGEKTDVPGENHRPLASVSNKLITKFCFETMQKIKRN
jgi:hypothetical protein